MLFSRPPKVELLQWFSREFLFFRQKAILESYMKVGPSLKFIVKCLLVNPTDQFVRNVPEMSSRFGNLSGISNLFFLATIRWNAIINSKMLNFPSSKLINFWVAKYIRNSFNSRVFGCWVSNYDILYGYIDVGDNHVMSLNDFRCWLPIHYKEKVINITILPSAHNVVVALESISYRINGASFLMHIKCSLVIK